MLLLGGQVAGCICFDRGAAEQTFLMPKASNRNGLWPELKGHRPHASDLRSTSPFSFCHLEKKIK